MKKSLATLACSLCVIFSCRESRAAELPRAKPESVGLSTKTLSKIDDVVKQAIKNKQTAGVVVLVLRKGKVVYFEAQGWQDVANKAPMKKETVCRIYSMTKPITTVAAMMLYEEGKFQLDDPITKYLPKFQPSKVYVGGMGKDAKYKPFNGQITVRDLMRHTSGLAMDVLDKNRTTPVNLACNKAKLFSRGLNIDQFCQELAKLPLENEPGKRFSYSLSINVLGKLVEVWSGKPLDQFLEQRLFKPLDMKDTGFDVPKRDHSRFASTYVADPKEGLKYVDLPIFNDVFLKPRVLIAGGRGLVSTARDYSRFLQMVLNGGTLDGHQFLKPKTIELMTRNHIPKNALPITTGAYTHTGFGFGLGWAVRIAKNPREPEAPIGECRWAGACGTRSWFSRKEQLAVIVMQQLWPPNHDIEFKIKPIVYSAIKKQ